MIDLGSYVNKTVPFKFRGVELRFDLSQALFSSFDIDVGTRLLLKTAARDPRLASARRILDEGCGVGVIGLCVAKAFPDAEVLLRDRDSLAVAFAERNRIANKLRGTSAWTDPLTGAVREARPAPRVEQGLIGDGKEDGRGFDFVFSNLPAKAGAPVLASFFDRLSGRLGPPLLVPGGRAAIVIVNPLAEAAAAWIDDAGLETVASERGGMHRVYIVERAGILGESGESAEDSRDASLIPVVPAAYFRGEARFKLAELSFRASGFWGLPEFDTPGFGSAAAAELLSRIRGSAAFKGAAFRDGLFLDPGVGHLALWASRALGLKRAMAASRDALSLLATGANLSSQNPASRPSYAGTDALRVDGLEPASFDLIAESPDIVSERDWIGPSWELAGSLLRSGGVYLAWSSATEMARLEKRKPAASGGTARWSLLGEKRKKGFVAAAWRKGY